MGYHPRSSDKQARRDMRQVRANGLLVTCTHPDCDCFTVVVDQVEHVGKVASTIHQHELTHSAGPVSDS